MRNQTTKRSPTMRRETKRFLEEDGYRVVNKIYSDPVHPDHAHKEKTLFIKAISDVQEILLCEMRDFDTLRIYQDGNHWIAETQVRVHEVDHRRK